MSNLSFCYNCRNLLLCSRYLTLMAKACAYLKGRVYVVPADVEEVFSCVVSHRIILSMKAKVGHVKTEEVVRRILEEVEKPSLRIRR